MLTKKQEQYLEECFYRIAKKAIAENRVLQEADKEKFSKNQKRKGEQVVDAIKNKLINGAEIARELWNPSKEEEDGARSLLSKKTRGEDGRHFTNQEINKAFNVINARV
jgi:hypothetical protein